MKFEFLKQLSETMLQEFGPHDNDLAMGDDIQYIEPGHFTTTIMGERVQVYYNEDSEIVDVEIDETHRYDRDLMGDLHTFAYNGGLGFTEFDPNFKIGMEGISYQRPDTLGLLSVSTIEDVRESGIDMTELTQSLWNEVWELSDFVIPLIPNYDENSVLVIPLEEDGNRLVCDVYYTAHNKDAGEFLTMAMYNDASGLVNTNLRLQQSSLADRVSIRKLVRVNDLEL